MNPKKQVESKYPKGLSWRGIIKLVDEVRTLREKNRKLRLACLAVKRACGPADDWPGDSRVFLRAVEMALEEQS